MDRPTFLVFSLLVLIGALELFHSYLEAEIGVLNYHYSDVLIQLDSTKYQNQQLRELILQESSLTTINNKVKDTFVPASHYYLKRK